MPLAGDGAFRDAFALQRRAAKDALASLVLERTGDVIDPAALFDVQVKRIHEYKRQLLNALQTVAALAGKGRAVAVLGDMLELGPEETEAHRELGAQAAKLPLLLFFGPRSRHGAEAARKAGAAEVLHTESPEEAVALLQARLRAGDVVLVKGSRGMRMERIVAGLTGEAASGGH